MVLPTLPCISLGGSLPVGLIWGRVHAHQLAGTSTWEMAPSPIANIFAQHELAPGSEQAREQLAQVAAQSASRPAICTGETILGGGLHSRLVGAYCEPSLSSG
jgi:hypothetical protein